jgi:hypothetical protein
LKLELKEKEREMNLLEVKEGYSKLELSKENKGLLEIKSEYESKLKTIEQ